MAEFEVGDRVRFITTKVPFEDLLVKTGDTGTVKTVDDIGCITIDWDEPNSDTETPWNSHHFEKIRPRVGHDRFQPGDKVKYAAGTTGRASRIGEIERTGVDMDGGSFAVVVTPAGVEATLDYDDLELIRRHERKAVPLTGMPKAITISFSYYPDERIPYIRDLDDLIEVLSENPDNITITE